MCYSNFALDDRVRYTLRKNSNASWRHIALLKFLSNIQLKRVEGIVGSLTANLSTSVACHVPFHQRPSGCPTCTNHASGFRLVSSTKSKSCPPFPAGVAGMSWARACRGAKAARGETWVSVFFEEDDAMVNLDRQQYSQERKNQSKTQGRQTNEVVRMSLGMRMPSTQHAWKSSASASAERRMRVDAARVGTAVARPSMTAGMWHSEMAWFTSESPSHLR